jgi:hypothetical protein
MSSEPKLLSCLPFCFLPVAVSTLDHAFIMSRSTGSLCSPPLSTPSPVQAGLGADKLQQFCQPELRLAVHLHWRFFFSSGIRRLNCSHDDSVTPTVETLERAVSRMSRGLTRARNLSDDSPLKVWPACMALDTLGARLKGTPNMSLG